MQQTRSHFAILVAFFVGVDSVRVQTEDQQIIETHLEVPTFVTKSFQPGDVGFKPDAVTSQVECVTIGGQAEAEGVQQGWWVHKIGGFYPYTDWRLSEFINGNQNYTIEFTNVRAVFNCVDLPSRWVDSEKRSCSQYAEKKWCTGWGTEGPGWPRCGNPGFWNMFCVDRTIEDYASQHMTALSACCLCGGGWEPKWADTKPLEATTTSAASTTVSTNVSTNAPTPAPSTTQATVPSTTATSTTQLTQQRQRASGTRVAVWMLVLAVFAASGAIVETGA
jgi:hypothetical protein